VRISRLAISLGQATSRPSKVPGLCPCTTALSLWGLGNARLLAGTPFLLLGNRQLPPEDSSTALLPDLLSSSYRRYRYIPTLCSEKDPEVSIRRLIPRCCLVEPKLSHREQRPGGMEVLGEDPRDGTKQLS